MRYTVLSALNIRSQPVYGSTIVGSLSKGAEIYAGTTQIASGNFHYVQLEMPYGKPPGYVAVEFLRQDGVATKYVTTTAINLRLYPSITGKWEAGIPAGTTINIYPGSISADSYVWWPTDNGWVASEYLRAETVITQAAKIGFHCFTDCPRDMLTLGAHNLYMKGKPIGIATVISDYGLVNSLIEAGLVLVTFRYVQGTHDPQPSYPQSEQAAIDYGIQWFNDRWSLYEPADATAYLQVANEVGYDPFDGAFYIGVMTAAEAKGRHVCIFNDSSGNPSGVDWVAKWQTRKGALQKAMQGGHILGVHVYGAPNSGNTPLSDPSNAYFATRFREFRATFSPDATPRMAITECGTNNSKPPSGGTLADMKALATLWASDNIIGFAYWTLGGQGEGWTGYDNELQGILAYLGN